MKSWLIAVLLVGCVFGADFEWRDYKSGLEEAQKRNLPILIMVSQKNCITCEYMDDVAFEDENLADYVENFWVPVKIDINEAKKLGFRVYGTPTFYFLTKDGKKFARPVAGGANAKVFLQKLKEVKNGL